MLKRIKELIKLPETQAAMIEALESHNAYLNRKNSFLEAIVSEQKKHIEAQKRINNINIESLWAARRENEMLKVKLEKLK